jgi:hypothetical protein
MFFLLVLKTMAFLCAKINNMMVGTTSAISLLIPGKGWFIFGGNTFSTSRKLVNVSSNWEAGPATQTSNIWGQCAVQVMQFVE